MNCCIDCFTDQDIKLIIEGLNKNGHCDYCNKSSSYILNIDQPHELTEIFEGLIDVYSLELPTNFPENKTALLKNILHDDWHIFSHEPDIIYDLVKQICRTRYDENADLFDSPVGIKELYDQDYLNNFSIMYTHEWDDFVKEIKTENRFHNKKFNKEVIDQFIEPAKKKHKAGKCFYRARICKSQEGFPLCEMGAPESSKATAGRANCEGIKCLYLADLPITAIYEVRAAAYDYVAVASFELKQDIEIINLAMIDRISPMFDIDFTQQAINLTHLRRIGREISKPQRRHDSTLDYLPTQYISDYIKSKGYLGIEYKSTMHEEGLNLAVFDESLLECRAVDVYEIDKLCYKHRKISKI